ncbi:MAG TPA: hypothetical protein PKL58_03455 [Methylophilaceae bacterium]|nr:hypothetical protein [Methylophilaceae bacterium]
MLKNIISAVFFTTILATSMPSLAVEKEVSEKVIATTSHEVTATSDQKSASSKNTQQSAEANNITTATASLLFAFALLGFVLLSNR